MRFNFYSFKVNLNWSEKRVCSRRLGRRNYLLNSATTLTEQYLDTKASPSSKVNTVVAEHQNKAVPQCIALQPFNRKFHYVFIT
uniref:Uncharacterized protein n=1 Tax=Pyxicephalus adspersus TaxID=30357 RepID=A0AAV3AHT7_PYXAD|nr:TPA: hypothetical protein GDO54_014458 [Pyxicephalus adspersus]